MMDYTPAGLAKRIAYWMNFVSREWAEETKRVYAKTWSIVELHKERLANPTVVAAGRLQELLDVIFKRREEERGGT